MAKPIYTEALAETILERIANGESMIGICRDEDMPSRFTVIRWMNENKEFATKCARAREEQADLMDDKILECADNCTPETAAADRVKISAYQWRASKLQPKKYGDKLEVDANLKHSGQITAVINITGSPIKTIEQGEIV